MYRDALECGRPYDAVILDLTVPGAMGGKKAVLKLKAMDPNVRAIVSSGFSNDPVMANYTEYGFCCAIKKPCQLQDISHVLHTAINS
jgi:two-component system cell cycle sensor histidine kinase/response regulator CckA